MKSTAEHIRKILLDNSLCSITYGDDWFTSIAAAPGDDKVILIRDTVSENPFYGMNNKATGTPTLIPGFQVVVFSRNYSDGYNKTTAIRDFLRTQQRVEVDDDSSSSSALYLDIIPKGGLFFAGLDESERYMWDLNFKTFREDN